MTSKTGNRRIQMNLREDEAPVVARGKDGRLGVVIIDTETKKPVKPWTAVDDLTPERREILRPYQQPGGRNNYRLDPDLFKKIEAAKKDPNPKVSPIIQQGLKPKPDPNQISPIFQRPTTTTTTTTPDPTPDPTPEPKTPEPKPVIPKSARQLELDKINADKTLTPDQKWAKANPGLAAVRREREAIRGTSETDNPLMQGLRSKLPAAKTALDTTALKADLAKSGINPSAYSRLLNNPRRMKYQQPSVEKEAYDVVLDYLLSEGHADTVEEAHYVMMQLDSEYVQSIVEQQAPDAKYYRNYLNDVLPGSAGPERQMPLIPPSIKQDALKNWMKTRGFPQAKKKSNNDNIA